MSKPKVAKPKASEYVAPVYQMLDYTQYRPHLIVVSGNLQVEYLDLTSRDCYFYDTSLGEMYLQENVSLERIESLLRGSVWDEPITNRPGVYGTMYLPIQLVMR